MPFSSSGRRRRSSLIASFTLLATSALFGSHAHADIDLTGRWIDQSGEYADIVQTGSSVTVTWIESATPITASGTFDQTNLSVSVPSYANLFMAQYGTGTILDGRLGYYPSTNTVHRRFTRCECYDGNLDAGDGCDSECRVEPCYSCTPEPSVCTPSADAASCDDRNDCTSGETCMSGTCTNGSTVDSCVNLTGKWRVARFGSPLYSGSESELVLTQRSGVVLTAGTIGLVEPSTGEFDLIARGGSIFCGGQSYTFSGTATLDNQEYSGTENYSAPTVSHCGGVTSLVSANRCDPVAGCSLSDCTGYDDGTACDDTNACTYGSRCESGVCRGISTCSACSTCVNGACETGPRPDCLGTVKSTSKLQITNREGDNAISWNWSHGEAFDADSLQPTAQTALTLCTFANGGSLVGQQTVSADTPCPVPPCWKGGDGSYKYTNKSGLSDFVSISLRSGVHGKSRIKLKGYGYQSDGVFEDLPAIPMSLPIVTQLQSTTGACFEATFDAEGVSRNADGMFRARGGSAE